MVLYFTIGFLLSVYFFVTDIKPLIEYSTASGVDNTYTKNPLFTGAVMVTIMALVWFPVTITIFSVNRFKQTFLDVLAEIIDTDE